MKSEVNIAVVVGPIERGSRSKLLVARALAALGYAYGDDDVHSDERGKPHVRSDEIKVGVAHTSALGCIAVSTTVDVGVDIETYRPLGDAVVKRALRSPEAAWVVAASGPERWRRFASLWTVKEAVAKAMGSGWPGTMPALAVPPPRSGRYLDTTWASFEPGWGLAAAVALAGDVTPVVDIVRSDLR
jgi:phosphopantetheinyl transferase